MTKEGRGWTGSDSSMARKDNNKLEQSFEVGLKKMARFACTSERSLWRDQIPVSGGEADGPKFGRGPAKFEGDCKLSIGQSLDTNGPTAFPLVGLGIDELHRLAGQ